MTPQEGPASWIGPSDTFPEPARCVVVGNVVFLSGFTGHPDSARVEDQVVAALDKARVAMEAAGGSMANIVKTFFLITRPRRIRARAQDGDGILRRDMRRNW